MQSRLFKVGAWWSLVMAMFIVVTNAAERPNIVLILSDDQAWTDYGFMGHPDIKTPNLDALASGGLLFERGYVASPLCRPSLASIVTGQFPVKHGITGNDILGGKQGLPLAERDAKDKPLREEFYKLPSFIRMLTSRGYLAHQSGKWWEGSWRDGSFTHGMTEGERHGDKGLTIGREGMQPISDFIDHAVAEKKPFFLWYAPFMPHTPHLPPERILKKYNKTGRPLDVSRYYAMVEWFDETCGDLMKTLKDKGLYENTVVIYICDNGWAAKSTTADWPHEQVFGLYAMRSKTSPYENGIRTPIIVSWPSKLQPKRMKGFAHAVDIFPTIAAIAELEAPTKLPGINLLDSKAVLDRTAIFGSVHSSHNITLGDPDDTLQYLWCIEGNWKLIVRYHGKDSTEYKRLHEWDTDPYHLFNLENDPAEKNDLAVARPEIVVRLKNKIESWRHAQAAFTKPSDH